MHSVSCKMRRLQDLLGAIGQQALAVCGEISPSQKPGLCHSSKRSRAGSPGAHIGMACLPQQPPRNSSPPSRFNSPCLPCLDRTAADRAAFAHALRFSDEFCILRFPGIVHGTQVAFSGDATKLEGERHSPAATHQDQILSETSLAGRDAMLL